MNPLPSDWKERLKQLREARKAIEERERKKGKPAPEAKTQYNFTDPDSRIVQESGNKGGYVQGYNCQIAVEAKSQVIVMAAVTQENPTNTRCGRCLRSWSGNWEGSPRSSSWTRATSARHRSEPSRRRGPRCTVPRTRGG